jgi:hypothetical protein
MRTSAKVIGTRMVPRIPTESSASDRNIRPGPNITCTRDDHQMPEAGSNLPMVRKT